MQYTKKLHLNKPEYTDNADIKQLNDNFDTLDEIVISKEFIITMPTDTTQYETITDAASKTYYKYTHTNAEVKHKFCLRDIYLGTETLLDNIDNMEDGYSNVIKVLCLDGSIEVYIKEIPTNTFYIKVAQ